MFNLHAHQRFHLGCDPSSRELEEQAIRAFAWNDINRHDRLGIAIFHADVFGFRATDANLGAIINILIYTPCFTLISMGIYNIEATHANRRKFHFVCSVIYIAIIGIFALSSYLNQGLYIGKWLYVMLALYFGNVVYCIYMIVQEMIKRKNMLETMAASDMLPYVRYARSSVVILFWQPSSCLSLSSPTHCCSSQDLLPFSPFSSSTSALWHSAAATLLPKNCWTRKKNRKKPSRRTQRGKSKVRRKDRRVQ